jgi:uncharacterized membrane protein HdeD (DUF308 family)
LRGPTQAEGIIMIVLAAAGIHPVSGCRPLDGDRVQSGIVPAALQVKALATAIGIVFLAEGVVNAFVSLAHRSTRGWGWGLANGLVTLVLGAMILSMGPAGLLSVIGLLVGICFLFSGFDLLRFSSSFHPRLE